MEYQGLGEAYAYNFAEVSQDVVKLKDLHAKIVRRLAQGRNWEYREDPKEETTGFSIGSKSYGYKTCARSGGEFRLPNNEVVFCLTYVKKAAKAEPRCEAVVMHWLADRSDCMVFVCPVYSPVDPYDGYYCSGSSSWYERDGVVYYREVESYDASADIHDRDRYTVESGCRYDPVKRELRYHIP